MPYGDFWSQYDDVQTRTDDVPNQDPGPPPIPTPPTTPGTTTPSAQPGDASVFGALGLSNGGGDGGDFPAFHGRSSLNFNIGNAPRFTAPRFHQPTFEEAQNEPGYAFSLDQGRKALEASASSRGTLNTGGTLKGVLDYGQKLGQQNYQNVFNRALSTFDRLYQGELDMYKPLLTEWSTKAAGSQRAAELSWLREMELYQSQIARWRHLTPSASDLINLELGALG